MGIRTGRWIGTVLAPFLAGCSAGVTPAPSPTSGPTESATVPSTPASTADSTLDPTLSPPPDDEPRPLTSHDLINAALAQGGIDDEQALVYRLFAVFADPRLPQEYQGDDTDLHGDSTVMEANERLDELSPETQAIVAPFMLWPGDEGSWLQERLAQNARIASLVGTAVHVELPHVPVRSVDDSRRVRFWYRVDRPQDAETARFLAGVVDREIWPKLTGLMGEPISDLGLDWTGGDDRRVDVLLTGEPIRWYAKALSGCAGGNPSAGFSALGAGGANSIVLTHELYAAYISNCFLRNLGTPLETRNDCREYGAYLFFQYLTRSYAPGYVREVWEAASGHDSLSAINAAVSPLGGLRSIWPEFALTAYNGDPITHYHGWDRFFHGARHEYDSAKPDGERTRLYPVSGDIEHLAAGHHRFSFDDAAIGRMTFKHPFADDAQPTAKVTAVVRYQGEDWAIEDWTSEGEKRFCYDTGDKVLDALVLIITNSEYQDRSAVLQSPEPYLEVAAGCTGDGTITISREKHGTYTSPRDNPVRVDMIDSATISFHLEAEEFSEDSYATVNGTVTWSYSLAATETGDGCSIIESAEGSGTYEIGEGPFVMLGVDENFNISPDSYILGTGAAAKEYTDGDPSTHYKVRSTICAEELPLDEQGLGWWMYFPDCTSVSGTIAEDGRLSGSHKATIEPLGSDDLPTTVTITWSVTLP